MVFKIVEILRETFRFGYKGMIDGRWRGYKELIGGGETLGCGEKAECVHQGATRRCIIGDLVLLGTALGVECRIDRCRAKLPLKLSMHLPTCRTI